MQQHLPFTVLKQAGCDKTPSDCKRVATALTVYGIETLTDISTTISSLSSVATALTVYGIETVQISLVERANFCCNSTYRLRY